MKRRGPDPSAILDARLAGDSYAAIGRRFGRSGVRIRQICHAESRRRAYFAAVRAGHDWRELPVRTTLDLPVRCRTTLARLGYVTMGEVAAAFEAGRVSWGELLIVRNFGARSWSSLVCWFADRGMQLPSPGSAAARRRRTG